MKRIIIARRLPDYLAIALSFGFVLFWGVPQGASAETPGQPVTSATTTASTTLLSSGTHTALTRAEAAMRFGPQVDPCYTLRVSGDNWMDQVHNFVQDNTCEPAIWFDTFFVKDHLLLDLRPGALIIVRSSARLTEAKNVDYVSDYHLEWELPQWEKYLKKWKLYIDSRGAAKKNPTEPGLPVEPGVDRNTGAKKTTIGLRADLYTRLRALISIDTGANIGLHPNAHVRMRYQYMRIFDDVYVFRFSEIALWQATEKFTDTTQADLERKLGTFSLLRWSNNVTFTEGKHGVTWNSGISHITQLTPKSAISYSASIGGVNDPEWAIQSYRVGSLYRRNFYRSWIFFELAPEVTWPKDKYGKRDSTFAFTATLEMQFGM